MKELLIYVFGQHFGTSFMELGTPIKNIEKILELKSEGLSPAEIHAKLIESGRVVVNKNVLQHRIIEEVERTIDQAKNCANSGEQYFQVRYPYELRYELYRISDMVKEQTCKSVQCRERGLSTDSSTIQYVIR